MASQIAQLQAMAPKSHKKIGRLDRSTSDGFEERLDRSTSSGGDRDRQRGSLRSTAHSIHKAVTTSLFGLEKSKISQDDAHQHTKSHLLIQLYQQQQQQQP